MTLAKQIENAVTKYLDHLGSDWQWELQRKFAWGFDQPFHGYVNEALGFGLKHLGHGATRVAFQFQDTDFVIKLEKKTEILNEEVFENANLREIVLYDDLTEYHDYFKTVLLKPLHYWEYNDVLCIIFPKATNEWKDIYTEDLDRFPSSSYESDSFDSISCILFDQYEHINTFWMHGGWVSIDYASSEMDSVIEEMEGFEMKHIQFQDFHDNMIVFNELMELELFGEQYISINNPVSIEQKYEAVA
jgi:hypothetical protein